MPSQRKRIGFLPSQEVHNVIEKLCKENNFSQSKVTGLLVEEALRSRGVLNDSFRFRILLIILLSKNYHLETINQKITMISIELTTIHFPMKSK